MNETTLMHSDTNPSLDDILGWFDTAGLTVTAAFQTPAGQCPACGSHLAAA